MVAQSVRRPGPPLRLTRRGRSVVLILLALIATAASAVLFTTASRASDDPSTPAPTVTVESGDTLWEIATAVLPQKDGREAVAELRQINHLDGYDLQPGQVLTLPRT